MTHKSDARVSHVARWWASCPPWLSSRHWRDRARAYAAHAESCWICFEGPRVAVLLECGHGGICMACAARLMRNKAADRQPAQLCGSH
eukprot:5171358-Pleurochrysis_carterae.AAC.1